MQQTIELQRPYVAAIVPAAGSATRMNGLDKQFEEIGGMPVIIRTLLVLAGSDWVDSIVLVAREDDIADLYTLIRAWAVPKVQTVVAGGASRQESVQNGLAAVSEDAQYILVHDGARPLVTAQIVADTIFDAMNFGAAAAAVPVVDTIKIADGERNIAGTPDRKSLFAVQTPQVFEAERYRQAMQAAAQAQKEYTDDCQLLESAGYVVHLSKGEYTNLKITTPSDLVIARALVAEYEEASL